MNAPNQALRVLARELYPDVTSVVCIDGQIDDLTVAWQSVDARLTEHGVTGADLVDETLFLRRMLSWLRRSSAA